MRQANLRWIFAAIIFLILCVSAVLGFEGPRSALVALALRGYLSSKGFHWQQGDLRLGGGQLAISHPIIKEAEAPFLVAESIRVDYRLHGTSLSLLDVILDRPRLVVRKETDGTLNLQRFSGGGPQAAPQGKPAPRKSAMQLHTTIALKEGTIVFANAHALAKPGRGFALHHVNFDARIDQGALSRGRLTATLVEPGVSKPLALNFFEDDRRRVGDVRASAKSVALAPVLDFFLNSPAFTVETGTADLQLHGYALQWPQQSSPVWHLAASGALHDGRIRVVPLIVPVRNLNGPLSFSDGILVLPHITGSIASVPLNTTGTLTLMPSVQLNLINNISGPLHQLRNMLAFLKPLPLRGTANFTAHVTGAPNDPLVAVDFSMPHGFVYRRTPVTSAFGSLTYSHQELTFPRVVATYAGLHTYGNGTADLGPAGPPSGTFVASIYGPSTVIPWLANLNDTGTISMRLSLSGLITQLRGGGFIALNGNRLKLRTAFDAGPERFSFGPLLATDSHGGSLWFSGSIDRLNDRATDAHLTAHHFTIASNGRRVKLPGIFEKPYGIPKASGIFDGALTVSGPLKTMDFAANLRGADLNVDSTNYGRLELVADGSTSRARIARLALVGRSLALRAAGDIARSTSGGLHGTMRGSLWARLNDFSRMAPVAGDANASFSAAFAEHQLLASMNLRGSPRLRNIPLQNANVVVGLRNRHLRVYAANARVAGGQILAAGDLSTNQKDAQSLDVAVSNLQLSDLRSAGIPLTSGSLTALADLSGTRSRPNLNVGAILNNGAIGSRPFSADTQLVYSGNALRTPATRILIGQATAVNVRGAINGVSPTGGTSGGNLDLIATIRDADLQDLTGGAQTELTIGRVHRAIPTLTGSLDGDLRIAGSMNAPSVSGNISSDVGAFRGVTYENLRSGVSASRSSIALRGGHIQLGTSALNLAGLLSPAQTQLEVTTPHVDLADFNDFFGGRDLFEGVGSGHLAVASSATNSYASGAFQLSNTMVAQLPLGSVRTILSTQNGSIVANIRQRSALATSDIASRVALGPHRGLMPDFARAHYDTTARIQNVDLAMLSPLLPASAEGVQGKLSLSAFANGPPRQLNAGVQFNLAHGYIHKDRIDELNGNVRSVAGTITVQSLRASMNGTNVAVRGTYMRNRTINAHADINARDVSTVARVVKMQDRFHGPANVALDVRGALRQPRVRAVLDAPRGTAYGVGYDSVHLDANYAPGRVSVRNAVINLAKRQGTITVAGTVPIPYGPQPTGETRSHVKRPMSVKFDADGLALAALNPILNGRGTLGGRFDADAIVTGSLSQPVFGGTAKLRGGYVGLQMETTPLKNLNADVAFSNDSISLSGVHGVMGHGTIDANGNARVVPGRRNRPATLAYAFNLVTNKANVNVPKFFGGDFTTNLTLENKRLHPTLSGDVTASDVNMPFSAIIALASGSGSAAPPQAARIPGVPPLRKGHYVWYGGAAYKDEVAEELPTPAPVPVKRRVAAVSPLALNITANAGKNVNVTGLVNATATGSVQVEGTPTSPKLNGTLSAIRGEAGAFNTIFHVIYASVAFDPADGLLPTIDAQAVAYQPSADVTVSIQGRVDQMRTQIVSDPPMSEQAILADLLHINQIDAALNGNSGGGGQGPLSNPGGAVQNFATAELTGKLLSALNYGLEQSLDINEVNLAFSPSGQPMLELRKQYGRNLYTLYRTTFQVPAQQAVGIAYVLRDALDFEFTQKQNTASDNAFQQGQTTSFQVNVKFD